MKYLTQIALVSGAVAALWAAPALQADEHADGMHGRGHHEMMGEMWKDKLGLSKDQASKLKTTMKSFWEGQRSLHKQMHENMKKLEAQITLKYKDSDIQATLDDLAANHKAMQDQHEKLIADLKSFLNPTQRGKLLLGMMKHMQGHHEMMHGGHEGFHKGGFGDDHSAGADMKDSLNDEQTESSEEAE